MSGSGVRHTARPTSSGRVRGYQLWLALSRDLELSVPRSEYLAPSDIPRVGPARVILGDYQGVSSRLPRTSPATYLSVDLEDGATWTFAPPTGQEVAWIAVGKGGVDVSGVVAREEVVVFADGPSPVHVVARGIDAAAARIALKDR